VVHEDVLTLIGGDESVPLLAVEPLDLALCHGTSPSLLLLTNRAGQARERCSAPSPQQTSERGGRYHSDSAQGKLNRTKSCALRGCNGQGPSLRGRHDGGCRAWARRRDAASPARRKVPKAAPPARLAAAESARVPGGPRRGGVPGRAAARSRVPRGRGGDA